LPAKAAYRSATQENSSGGHAGYALPNRDYEKDPVADKTLVTDLSATEFDELAYRKSLRSELGFITELQCIM
jgi:hypothetical protein